MIFDDFQSAYKNTYVVKNCIWLIFAFVGHFIVSISALLLLPIQLHKIKNFFLRLDCLFKCYGRTLTIIKKV